MLRSCRILLVGGYLGVTLAGCAASVMSDKLQGVTEVEKLQKESKNTASPVNFTVAQHERSSDDKIRKPIITKYAYFEPTTYRNLPGWEEDQLTEAWQAFRQSCKALSKRSAWSKPCERSTKISFNNNTEIRAFIEEEFDLYQIFNIDRKSTGEITGYYEPIVNGSRTFGAPYIYPIYGVPDDLLFVDSRAISTYGEKRPMLAQVQGRVVKLMSVAPGVRTKLYKLELEGTKPDIRDKKIRVRIEGDRIVPYWTRTEIEQGRAYMEKVLAWVDDPSEAYSMQMQGSGRVRFPNGKIMRLAYGEQNGWPFQPPVVPLTRSAKMADMPMVRGFALDIYERSNEEIIGTEQPIDELLTRGGAITKPSDGKSDSRTSHQNLTPEVARMVDALLPGRKASGSKQGVKNNSALDDIGSTSENKISRKSHTSSSRPAFRALKRLASFFWNDPSYVFFREIPDTGAGPIGALGVPLTAGRSLAVDPRTAPLGFPVFVATSAPGKGEALNRLMLAQDTGGAIRGAVRADYFWGVGVNAFANASRMKESGRMWLLTPKDLKFIGRKNDFRTRGLSDISESECLVPDPELCVE